MVADDIYEVNEIHEIEWGKSTYNNSFSIRNRYKNKKGGYNIRASSELFWWDFNKMILESIKRNKFSSNEITEILHEISSLLEKKSIKNKSIKKNKLLDSDIFKQNLSTRVSNILKHANINTFREFFKKIKNVEDWKALPNGGLKSYSDIIRTVEQLGLKDQMKDLSKKN